MANYIVGRREDVKYCRGRIERRTGRMTPNDKLKQVIDEGIAPTWSYWVVNLPRGILATPSVFTVCPFLMLEKIKEFSKSTLSPLHANLRCATTNATSPTHIRITHQSSGTSPSQYATRRI
ncbi:hypothetical protein J6590_001504 [Homalodisca vitripennis]|nr:hypothetical protein J6590_001504 [Homalodisca vitripennis]